MQATQAIKLAELSARLEAAAQQHSRDLKALEEKHRRQQEAETERMAKVGRWANWQLRQRLRLKYLTAAAPNCTAEAGADHAEHGSGQG